MYMYFSNLITIKLCKYLLKCHLPSFCGNTGICHCTGLEMPNCVPYSVKNFLGGGPPYPPPPFNTILIQIKHNPNSSQSFLINPPALLRRYYLFFAFHFFLEKVCAPPKFVPPPTFRRRATPLHVLCYTNWWLIYLSPLHSKHWVLFWGFPVKI